jgi:hypothetical protein
VAFFYATIDNRNLIFGHKLHIGMPYCGKRFWTCQILGQKTLPTIWGTYMKLVTKYQISAINSCWEKCDEKCAYTFNVYKNQLSRQTGRIFLSNRWWQKSDIWSQASYIYTILWVAFLDPSDSYFLFADLVGFYTHWTCSVFRTKICLFVFSSLPLHCLSFNDLWLLITTPFGMFNIYIYYN